MIVIACIVLAACLLVYIHFRKEKPENTAYINARGELSVHFIDVGQGDCTLIISDGQTMLIDCGENEVSGEVKAYLRNTGVEKLDYIIATHPHSDHMGGMYDIIGSFGVGEVIIPHLPDEDIPDTLFFERFLDSCADNEADLFEAQVGRVITLGGAQAEIVAPCSGKYDDLNDYSVSILLSFGSVSFLLTGDAEETSELEMLDSGRLPHVTVYKAGHHGSRYSSTQEFLDVITPEYAVISCGAENPYGHPNDDTVERLLRYTERIYRTDIDGTVVFTSDGENISVNTERSGHDNY